MILTPLSELDKYSSQIPSCAEIRQFVSHTIRIDASHDEPLGNGIIAKISVGATKDRIGCNLETHRRYIDIHVVVSGSECIEWYPREIVSVKTSYNEAIDAEFYHAPTIAGTSLIMQPGMAAVFFPSDAHMPLVAIGSGVAPIAKIVFKVPVAPA